MKTEGQYFLIEDILQFLPSSSITLVLGYLGSSFLNSSINNTLALSHIGAFFDITDLMQFFLINKTILNIFPSIIREQFNQSFQMNSINRIIKILDDGLSSSILLGDAQKILLLLLKSKLIDINFTILDSPLIVHAIEFGRTNMVQYLINQGAKLKNITNLEEKDLIHLAFKRDNFKLVKIFQPYFAPISIKAISGKNLTFLMQAIVEGEVDFIKEIIKTRQDEINFFCGNESPLTKAVLAEKYEIVQLLLENKAIIESKQGHNSPLTRYIHNFQYHSSNCPIGEMPTKKVAIVKNIIDLLLQHGDQINGVDSTFLERLMDNDQYAVIKELIEHGVSHDSINIFSIYHRLKYIFDNSRNIDDFDLLQFWLNLLIEKIPQSSQGFEPLLYSTPILVTLDASDKSPETLMKDLYQLSLQVPVHIAKYKQWDKFIKLINPIQETFIELRTNYSCRELKESRSRNSSADQYPHQPKILDNFTNHTGICARIFHYLSIKSIFFYCLPINQSTSKIVNSYDFWQREPSESWPTILWSAIMANAFELMWNRCFQKKLNFKLIFSLKPIYGKFVLEYIFSQTQLSLKLPYLTRGKIKKMDFEEKLRNQLSIFHQWRFDYLRFPKDEWSAICGLINENNIYRIQLREARYLHLLNIFKTIIDRDLPNFDCPDNKKLQFLKLYLEILFFSHSDIHLDKKSDEFHRVFLSVIKDCEINFRHPYGYLTPFNTSEINGLMLAAKIGNIYALEYCKETIESFLNLRYALKENCPHSFLDDYPEKLLSIAAIDGQEAVMQFLFELGVKAPTITDSVYPYYTALHNALLNKQYGAAILTIAHGGSIHIKVKDIGGPLIFIYYPFTDFFDLIGLLILYTADASVYSLLTDDEPLLIKLAAYVYPLLAGLDSFQDPDLVQVLKLAAAGSPQFNLQQKPLPQILEELRLLLILRANAVQEVKSPTAKAVIDSIIKVSQSIDSKMDQAEMTNTYCSALKRICFFHALTNNSSSPDQKNVSSLNC